MDSALTIASVTAVLKSRIEDGLADRGVSASIGADATVSALAPDRIPVGEEERPRVNLFLYQVTPNSGLRAKGGQSNGGDGRQPNNALALDLHYLLSAYGAQDFQAEILLGYALQLLHGTPVVKSEAIRTALAAQSSTEDGRVVSPSVAALRASGLPDLIDEVVITPQFLDTESLSRLWSALQTHLRPSAAYRVSLVLIERGG